MAPPRIFLSHSHKDYPLANRIKETLEDALGLQVFVAHQDIKPSLEWRDTIVAELKRCNALVALLTKNFENSDWTDQELGIAYAYEKVVIPIRVSVMPYGFIERFQALTWDKDHPSTTLKELAKTLVVRRVIDTDALIAGLEHSPSFDSAGFAAELLLEVENFSKSQIARIAKAFLDNSQVTNSFVAQRQMKQLFRGHLDELEPGLRVQISNALRLTK